MNRQEWIDAAAASSCDKQGARWRDNRFDHRRGDSKREGLSNLLIERKLDLAMRLSDLVIALDERGKISSGLPDYLGKHRPDHDMLVTCTSTVSAALTF